MACFCPVQVFKYFGLVKMQEFYEDLFQELSKYGEIESLNICDNLADHMVCNWDSSFFFFFFCLDLFYFVGFDYVKWWLFWGKVGNVYVQFREEEHAANALRNLSGRFYAG